MHCIHRYVTVRGIQLSSCTNLKYMALLHDVIESLEIVSNVKTTLTIPFPTGSSRSVNLEMSIRHTLLYSYFVGVLVCTHI